MSTIIIERFDSRESTEDIDNPTVDLIYSVIGTEDDADVKTLVESTVPAMYQGLVFQSYHIAPQGGGVWEASARYGKRERKEPGYSSFSFDTGGGTQHISQSLQTLGSYAASGTPPSFQGAIGVTTDSVEGADITVPVYSFQESHILADALVTGAYKLTLFGLTGRINAANFRGFAAGEVLFLGAAGSKRGTEDWEITYRFAASANVSGLSLGPISGITKRGWDYLWVRYADAVDQNVLIKRPIAAYVERVYLDGNFSLLGI